MSIEDFVRQQVSDLGARLTSQLTDQHNRAVGGVRKQLGDMLSARADRLDAQLGALSEIAKGLRVSRTGDREWNKLFPDPRDIPGKRIPYLFVVDIPIANGTTSVREQTMQVSQEGILVVTSRMCTFQSALEFQYTDRTGQTSLYPGRSFGRYRPTSSVFDSQDASASGTALARDVGGPADISRPNAASGFRTMEFDGRIYVVAAGSAVPRSNAPVPTPAWAPHDRFREFACEDIFERGEAITVSVAPTHLNNPPAGNTDGSAIFGTDGWPFIAGQYDNHEGITTPGGITFAPDGTWTRATTDSIVRLPDGILSVIFEGYRIMNPATGIV